LDEKLKYGQSTGHANKRANSTPHHAT